MGYQQLLTAGTGFIEVDGRIDPFFCQASLEVNFGVTCALELLVNYLVHAATRLYQGGAYDGQRAPFLEIAGRTKEALGSLQGISIHAASQHLSRGGHNGVICTGQAGNGIQQNDHIFFQLYQTFGLFDDHFCYLYVTCGRLIKSGCHHLAAYCALHFRDLLWAFIHQEDNNDRVGIIGSDGMSNMLHHDGLAGFWTGDDQCTLAFAYGGKDIKNATSDVFLAFYIALEYHALIRMQRRQVFKHDSMFDGLGLHAVDLVYLDEGKIALTILGRTYLPLYRITCM